MQLQPYKAKAPTLERRGFLVVTPAVEGGNIHSNGAMTEGSDMAKTRMTMRA